jgi:hypothetical protein
MLLSGMIEHIIEVDAYPLGFGGINQGLEAGFTAVSGVYLIIIVHIIGMIGAAGVDGR